MAAKMLLVITNQRKGYRFLMYGDPSEGTPPGHMLLILSSKLNRSREVFFVVWMTATSCGVFDPEESREKESGNIRRRRK